MRSAASLRTFGCVHYCSVRGRVCVCVCVFFYLLTAIQDPRHTDPFLRYFMLSHVKLRDRYPTLFRLMDSALPPQRDVLQALFSPELAVAELARDDLDLLRHYLLRSYTAFLTKWTSLHPLAAAGRHATLQPLQKLVELEDFLAFVQDPARMPSNEAAAGLLAAWERRWPSASLDSMKVWDDVIHNRSLMLDKLVERRTYFGQGQAEAGGEEVEALKQTLMSSKANMYLAVARGARKQGNYYVADQYMRLCLKASKDKQAFASIHALVKLFYLRACKADAADEKAEKLCKALKFMESKRVRIRFERHTHIPTYTHAHTRHSPALAERGLSARPQESRALPGARGRDLP